jgi:hypothetical protein
MKEDCQVELIVRVLLDMYFICEISDSVLSSVGLTLCCGCYRNCVGQGIISFMERGSLLSKKPTTGLWSESAECMPHQCECYSLPATQPQVFFLRGFHLKTLYTLWPLHNSIGYFSGEVWLIEIIIITHLYLSILKLFGLRIEIGMIVSRCGSYRLSYYLVPSYTHNNNFLVLLYISSIPHFSYTSCSTCFGLL